MKQKLTKFFNLIKNDRQAKILTIVGVLLLFIFTIGYSLSAFTGNKNSNVANIKVNDLAFNITTNSGESDDRILHLQAGKTEQFNIVLTNLNKLDVKYEFIYEICNDSNCTSTSNDKSSDLLIYKENENTEINGSISKNKFKTITILTNNKSTNDYYIKLGLNAGYIWNDLVFINQINDVVSLDKDINIIAYVDGVEVKELPSTCFYEATSTVYKNNVELIDSNVSFTCNYATGKWDINVSNLDNIPNKLVVNFESKGINAVEYVSKVQELDSDNKHGLFIDPTVDKNVRYTGSEPKNYVKFGNDGELWRIIGIFNITDSSGVTSKKLKLVRDESLGSFSWDATGNNNYGFNDWTEADLMSELNGDYLNTALTANKTNWYNSYSDSSTNKPTFRQTGVFDYTKVIKSNYQNMISESVWNIGGNSYTDSAPYTLNLLSQYNRERGTIIYQNSGPTKWTGKVGLIYPSDYGYATTLAECHENLRAGIIYDKANDSWDFSNGKCKTDNWLFKNSWYWTLSPYSGNSAGVFHVGGDGTVRYEQAYYSGGACPAVFLKSDIKITSGTGEKGKPYILSL